MKLFSRSALAVLLLGAVSLPALAQGGSATGAAPAVKSHAGITAAPLHRTAAPARDAAKGVPDADAKTHAAAGKLGAATPAAPPPAVSGIVKPAAPAAPSAPAVKTN